MTASLIYLIMTGGAAFATGGPGGSYITMAKTTTAGQLVILRFDTTVGGWSPN
jgi:hypothetical protein